MFLKKLTLHNIRSYERQEIVFEEGITLLAGDIGSGKTTLLLALEFALFGILRGKTTPQELLRHSAKEGSVTLVCELQDHEVSITRALRRRGSSISQLPGELTIDGHTEELVPTEMKAKILNLMGYPESLLSKSTNLFRYTVYTPQEQVKHILHETVDERKDVIRKIFQIDKYQLVSANTTVYTAHLREQIAHFKGQLEDLKTLREQKQSQEQEFELVSKQLPALQAAEQKAQSEVQLVEKQLLDLQNKLTAYEAQKNTLLLLEKELQHLKSYSQLYQKQLVQLESQFKEQQPISEWTDLTLKKLQELLEKCAEKKAKLRTKLGELQGKKSTYQETTIQHLETCPVCKQEVSAAHKAAVATQQQEALTLLAQKEEELKNLFASIEEKEQGFKEKLLLELAQEKKFALLQQEQKQQELRKQEHARLLEQQTTTLNAIVQKEKEISEQQLLLKNQQPVDAQPLQATLQQKKVLLEQAQRALTTAQTRSSIAKKTLEQLTITITQKEAIAKKTEMLTSLKHWLQELFLPLIATMEKRVLLRVYQEFQSYFTQWFSLLVQDQELEVRLDEEFTPLVYQQGFDTSITNLSGGEKTGVALAYRLALNKVLNDYFSSLHTKGLLILDEPTDGFSSEQIDRLREVFEQIGVKQLLLVSHEPRLESVADHVVRVHKQHHQSLVDY